METNAPMVETLFGQDVYWISGGMETCKTCGHDYMVNNIVIEDRVTRIIATPQGGVEYMLNKRVGRALREQIFTTKEEAEQKAREMGEGGTSGIF